jgi:hypothetical protein
MTCVFDYDARSFPTNPLYAETPFGMPVIVSVGDVCAERDALEESNTRLTQDREALVEALDNLLGHWRSYTSPEWGNQEQAYYCLAKGAAHNWEIARTLVQRIAGDDTTEKG